MIYNYKKEDKHPFVLNIERETLENRNYRTTLWTGHKLQMTTMEIQPGDDIGLEAHHEIDQFLRIEQGIGLCKMGKTKNNLDFETPVKKGDGIFVPADTWHDVINTGNVPLKLYTIYAGPNHVPGVIHKTHFDAKTDSNEI